MFHIQIFIYFLLLFTYHTIKETNIMLNDKLLSEIIFFLFRFRWFVCNNVSRLKKVYYG
jgi:hypothetical protein